ncbi:MAG: hypothetical protein KAG97_07920 [Victivallales bacterium]|nr:hypothetical protein [Victivallales bacterium]
MNTKQISAAIDFSTDVVALAVQDANAETTTFKEIMPPRDSSRLATWVVGCLTKNGVSTGDVNAWTCGTGPGSFTALRCVAALTAGFASASPNTQARGVPSALALAAELATRHPDAARFAILYDGRRGEALCMPVERKSATFALPDDFEIFPVSGDDDSALSSFDVVAATTKEKKGLSAALSARIVEKIVFIDSFPVERLLSIEEPRWDMDSLLNPIYLRPATHVAPTIPREI